VGAGLVALMGLTTYAVASVSVWLVPAYLALMVLIFVTPRGRRPSAKKPGAGSVSTGAAAVGQGLRMDRAARAADHRPAAELDVDPAVSEATTEPSGSRPEFTGSGIAKPRRGRVRARKAAKTAVEPAPDSASVSWIRVGPGKFVRADNSVQAVDQAQAAEVAAGASPVTDVPATALCAAEESQPQVEEVTADASPAADAPTPATMTPTAPAVALSEQASPDLPAWNPGDVEAVTASDGRVSGPVTEEYGIAPSAFGPAPLDTSSAGGLDHDVPGVVAKPDAEPGRMAKFGGKASWHGADGRQRWSQRRNSRGRAGRVSRGIASAMPGVGRVSSRRNVRPDPRSQTSVRSSFAPSAHVVQSARRASGRIAHVERALPPRSPPRR
jgi:hypothetical protein